MINSLPLLLDIDGTLCPVSPGPDVAMRHLSIGSGSVSFRADLPEVLAELAARYELAWATAWQDNANLLLAPALGLPALQVVRFMDPAADEVGLRHTGRTWKLPGVQRFAADRRSEIAGLVADRRRCDYRREIGVCVAGQRCEVAFSS
jgi:hypothetical protein